MVHRRGAPVRLNCCGAFFAKYFVPAGRSRNVVEPAAEPAGGETVIQPANTAWLLCTCHWRWRYREVVSGSAITYQPLTQLSQLSTSSQLQQSTEQNHFKDCSYSLIFIANNLCILLHNYNRFVSVQLSCAINPNVSSYSLCKRLSGLAVSLNMNSRTLECSNSPRL